MRLSRFFFRVNTHNQGSLVYPGYSMSACKPQDGAEIRLRFTLALGKDIGGFNADAGVYGASSGNYYREW